MVVHVINVDGLTEPWTERAGERSGRQEALFVVLFEGGHAIGSGGV